MNVHKDSPVFTIGEERVSDRILDHATGEYRKILTNPDGTIEPPPSALQVAAVLHALSDLSLNQRMLDDEVKALGDERIGDPSLREADGLGHFFNTLAELIEEEVRENRFEYLEAKKAS